MKSYHPIPITYKLEFHVLPFDSFSIHTRLSLEEVRLVMDGLVERNLSLESRKLFHGTLGYSSFTIFPISGARNSFLPRIKGDIARKEEGCVIRITAQPYPFFLIFMGVWLTLALFFCLGILFSGQAPLHAIFTAVLVLLMGWLFPSFCFWIPESRARALLIKWFQNYDRG